MCVPFTEKKNTQKLLHFQSVLLRAWTLDTGQQDLEVKDNSSLGETFL